MAEKRMFAKTIVLSDAFLDMPMSARCLYFTLGMLADDDGFVGSPRSIMRQCGASTDDMNILLAKKFLLKFDNGVIVIKHWRINNYIRNDRYTETVYTEEKAMLDSKDNGGYTLKEQDTSQYDTLMNDTNNIGIPVGIPSGIPDDNQRYTQNRIDKNRIDKSSINTTSSNDDAFDVFWKAYPKKVGKADARKKFKKIDVDVDVLLDALNKQKRSEQWNKDNGQYIPNPSTWLNQRRWEDELDVNIQAESRNERYERSGERAREEGYSF